MASNTFDSTCAEAQILASNLSIAEVQDCMGDSDADQEHSLLKVLKQTCSHLCLTQANMLKLSLCLTLIVDKY